MDSRSAPPREFTGRHMAIITVSAFAVIIAVNVVMAVKAVGTFPGLEVANSYVASQSFDRDRKAQEALGWTAAAAFQDGRLRLALTGRDGAPAEVSALAVTLGRSTERNEDQTPALSFDGAGWVAPVTLGKGYWQVRIAAAAADGTAFRQRLVLLVR